MSPLFDKRLLVVTGKGGTGKSTVALTLGLIAARRGMRTIVAEVARQDRAARAFRRVARPFAEEELAPNLFTISIDPQHALQEYLRDRIGRFGDLLTASRTFQYFVAATPGMAELVSMGKVWELAQLERRRREAARYDLVVLDAPATGHGVAMLRAPRTFADVARVGPIAHQGRKIDKTITDAEFTGVLAVARAEEMPVVETLELAATLRGELGLGLERIIVNGLHPDRLTSRDRTALRRTDADGLSAVGQAAVRTAIRTSERARRERALMRRLRAGDERPPATLPWLYADELGVEELGGLADLLEGQL